MKNIRILHLLSQKPDATGSGITIRAIMEEAHKKGHENYLLAGIPEGEFPVLPAYLKDASSFVEFESRRLPFKIPGMSDVMPYGSTRFFDLTPPDLVRYENCFKEKVVEAVNVFKPHIIHSHHLWLLTGLVKKAFPSLPLVAHCHGTDLRQFNLCPHLRKKVLSGCSGVNGVIALSMAQKKEISQLYNISPDSVHLTGTGYDDQIFYRREGKTSDKIHIVYAGKLSRAKGVYWLLAALEEIKDMPFHLHLAGSGSGPEKEEVLRQADRMKDRVTLHGHINQKDLAELMRKSHIFVLPSFYEGFPLVLIEALACECRVVVTELPAVSEVRGEYDPGDVLTAVPLPSLIGPDRPAEKDLPSFVRNLRNSLKKQIEVCISGESYPEEKVSSLLKYYTWQEVFKRIERVYEKILSEKSINFPP